MIEQVASTNLVTIENECDWSGKVCRGGAWMWDVGKPVSRTIDSRDKNSFVSVCCGSAIEPVPYRTTQLVEEGLRHWRTTTCWYRWIHTLVLWTRLRSETYSLIVDATCTTAHYVWHTCTSIFDFSFGGFCQLPTTTVVLLFLVLSAVTGGSWHQRLCARQSTGVSYV
jgi:hypothetical protein